MKMVADPETRARLNVIFRAALILILVFGLIVAIWHVSWLHKQGRYDVQMAERRVVILDREKRVVYIGSPYDDPVIWHTSPLPNAP